MDENSHIIQPAKVKILIVDDHPLISYGLKAMLVEADANFDVVATAASVAEAKAAVNAHADLDLVLLDILLPDGNGIEVLNHIRLGDHHIKVIAFSSVDDVDLIVNLVQAGLDGFVNKECDESVMVEAIRSVMAGFEYFGKPIAQLLKDVELNSNMGTVLTNREIEIMRLSAEGYTAQEAADMLCISRRTIESHKAKIFSKLKINTTAELVKYAFKYKLVRLS